MYVLWSLPGHVSKTGEIPSCQQKGHFQPRSAQRDVATWVMVLDHVSKQTQLAFKLYYLIFTHNIKHHHKAGVSVGVSHKTITIALING